jgi:hypothetical protein
MKTIYEVIDELMQYKADEIKKLGIDIPYYTDEDRKNLYKLSKKKLIKFKNHAIYGLILFNVKKISLSMALCPFCYDSSLNYCKDMRKCDNCLYAKIHKVCFNYNSDYCKIVNILLKKRKEFLLLRDDLKKILKQKIKE